MLKAQSSSNGIIRLAKIGKKEEICLHCGSIVNKVFPHHIKTWEEFPELRFELSNGNTLCASCHTKADVKIRRNKQRST